MFILPFDTSLSMWMVPIPRFEWVPVPPPPPVEGACNGEGALPAPEGGESAAPAMPMVLMMTGFHWSVYRVWNAVPNFDWDAFMSAQQMPDRIQDKVDDTQHVRREAPRPVLPAVASKAGEDAS